MSAQPGPASRPDPRTPARRSGPRGPEADLRSVILDAARPMFADRGYRDTTMRAVAQAAGVDVALVAYYFGNKEGLFAESMDIPVHPEELIGRAFADGPDAAGPRLVEMFLGLFESPATGPALVGMLRSAVSDESTRKAFSEFVATAILRHYEELMPGPDTRRRIMLVGSQLIGTAMLRFVLRIEPMVERPRDQLVADLGLAVQRHLTGELPAEPG
jgi:AcrR family transcriptional regulator